MQLVATPLIVLALGGSAFDVSLAFALQFTPILLIAPIGGVLADRIPKRKGLLILQCVSVAQASTYLLVVATDSAVIPIVLVLSLVNGLVGALDMPMRTSFIAELLPDEDLPNGVALMMVAFNGSRIIGPAVAGVVVATLGFEATFIWSAVLGVVTLGLLASMDGQRSRPAPQPTGASVLRSLLAGLRYAATTRSVRTAIAIIAAHAVFGLSFLGIAPVYAIGVLGMDGAGYGLLIATMGVGAVAAAIPMTLVTLPIARRLMLMAPLVFSGLQLALGLNTMPAIAFLLIAPLGFFSLLVSSSVSVTIQSLVSHDLRGRVMGLYIAVMQGGSALGALFMGGLAETFGVPFAMTTGAILLASSVLALILLTRLYPEPNGEQPVDATVDWFPPSE